MKTLLTTFLLLTYFSVFSQNVDISGYVQDADAGTPVAKAEVILESRNTSLKTTVEETGLFKFQNVALGTYKLIVKMTGYKTVEKEIVMKDQASALRDYAFIIVQLPKVGSTLRTRNVNYTDYDQFFATYYQSKNKIADTERWIKIAERDFLPQDEEYFYVYYMAANTYNMAGMIKEAIVCTNKCIEMYEKYFPFATRYASPTVSKELAEASYYTLGSIYMLAHLYESAANYFESKKPIFARNTSLKTSYLTSLGTCYLMAGRIPEALAAAEEIKTILDKGDPITTPITVSVAGMEEYYKKLNEHNEKVQRLSLQMQYHLLLSTIYYNQYDFEKMAAHQLPYRNSYREMMQMALNPPQFAAPTAPPPVSAEQKKLNERISRFQSISMAGTNVLPIIAYCKTKKQEEAKQFIEGDVDRAYFNLLTKDFVGAEQALLQYEAKLKEFENDVYYKVSVQYIRQSQLQYLVQARVLQGKYDESLRDARKILEEVELKFKNGFTFLTEGEKKELMKDYSKQLDFYFSILLLASDKDKAKANDILNKVLQTKGLILEYTKKQNEKLKAIRDPALRDMITRVQLLRTKQTSFNEVRKKDSSPQWMDSILVNGKKINDLEQSINQKLGTAEDFLTNVTWQDVQKKLKDGEVYLEIVRIARDSFMNDKPKVQYWAFVIRPGSAAPDYFMISEGEAFESRNLRFYQNNIRTMQDDMDSYNVYWQKINEAIKGARNVFVSSDGAYHLINPLTLKNPTTNKFVLDELEVTRVSSGRDLLATAKAVPSASSVTLIGNPDFKMSRKGKANTQAAAVSLDVVNSLIGTRAGIEELPGTEKEIQMIGSVVQPKGLKVVSLQGQQAIEANVKALKSPSVLHFATHGQFDDIQDKTDSYMKSKLVLAGAGDPEPFSFEDYQKYDDGFLTGYEVTQLDLSNTQLTVLSACQTGLGDLQGGEGVWGLQRAFQLAGSRAVMGSLWNIDDQTTVLFMDAFYKSWMQGDTFTNAYRQAMTTTRAKFPHPYYWGPFVLLSN